MKTVIINQSNASDAARLLTVANSYFIITVDVELPTGTTTIGKGSVLAFRGGSFFGKEQGAIVDLLSCQISAAPYPIFTGGITVKNFANTEVKAEWFRLSEDTSDDVYINRAISMAKSCPVVLESRTYTLQHSIKFTDIGQTLICPGTLKVSSSGLDVPAIDVNKQRLCLRINKITGSTTAGGEGNIGIGILFSAYTEHSDIEVNTMSNLHVGFCVLPDSKGKVDAKGKPLKGGVQYCRIKFGSISANYCFYIDVFSKAWLENIETDDIINTLPTEESQLQKLKVRPLNWFNENQITGELMQGAYGIYVVSPTEAWVKPSIYPDNVSNVLNGLKFENISFENITTLPIRLRSVIRSSFINLQMFNSLPGNNSGEKDCYAPWIDLDNIKEVRMSFNSFVVPTHIKVGNNCKNSYIYGAILDNPETYSSHFDTLGIDTLWSMESGESTLTQKSQMFVTNSVVPFNMAKNIVADASDTTEKYLCDLLPNLKTDETDSDQINLPVLPSSVNVKIKAGNTLVLDLTGLDNFAPCLYTVNATIAEGGKLKFRASNYFAIQGGTYYSGGTTILEVTSGGVYRLQWLSNWTLQIKKES